MYTILQDLQHFPAELQEKRRTGETGRSIVGAVVYRERADIQ